MRVGKLRLEKLRFEKLRLRRVGLGKVQENQAPGDFRRRRTFSRTPRMIQASLTVTYPFAREKSKWRVTLYVYIRVVTPRSTYPWPKIGLSMDLIKLAPSS